MEIRMNWAALMWIMPSEGGRANVMTNSKEEGRVMDLMDLALDRVDIR